MTRREDDKAAAEAGPRKGESTDETLKPEDGRFAHPKSRGYADGQRGLVSEGPDSPPARGKR